MTATAFPAAFRELEAYIARDKGDFVLFALFLREDVPNRWDLIVSAPWVSADKNAAVAYIVDAIRSHIGSPQLTQLSRIVVAEPENPAVQAITHALGAEHQEVEVQDSEFFGLPIKRAIIITSKLAAAGGSSAAAPAEAPPEPGA